MSGSGRLSFGFSKSTSKARLLSPSGLSEEVESKGTSIDYITSFDRCIPYRESDRPEERLIIPLRMSRPSTLKSLDNQVIGLGTSVDLIGRALNSFPSAIPNSIAITPSTEVSTATEPPGKDVLAVEDAVDPDYNQVPVEDFGLALLRGMGLKEGDINQRSSECFAAKLRLKGLGLGADHKVLLKSRKMIGVDSEKLIWKVGAKCQIVYGRHEGRYGIIQGMDGDIGRVMVKLTTTEQIVNVMQATVRLVSSSEFENFGCYLNIAGAKRYKVDEIDNANPIHCLRNGKRAQSEVKMEPSPSKRKREDHLNCGHQPTWLQEGLIVRYLNRESKYYLRKVKILSVSASRSHQCSCETEDGRTLQNIYESDLQPTIPHRSGETVSVIRGQHSGKTGRLVERNDRSLRACISLNETGEEVSLHYGDVCCSESLR